MLLEDELSLVRYELGIHFVSTKRMGEINWEYLQHEGSTDVISFDYREGYSPGTAEFEGLDLAGGNLYFGGGCGEASEGVRDEVAG